MAVIESELDKKMREKFSRMKSSAHDFLQHQKEGMEMMSEVSRGVYEILEKVAADEINKDPLAFIRRESFMKKQGGLNSAALLNSKNQKRNSGKATQGEMQVYTGENEEDVDDDEFKDAYDDGKRGDDLEYPSDLYNPALIQELENAYHNAHENAV